MMDQLLNRKLIKPALVAAVLLLSVVPAFITNYTFLFLLLGACLGLGGLYFLFKWPALGVVLLVGSAIIVPFEIGTGSQTNINAAMLLLAALLGLWFARMFIEERRFSFVPSRTVMPLVLMVISAMFSLLVGQLNWFPIAGAPIRAQIGGLMLFVFAAGAFLLAANMIKEVRWLEYMVWTFLGLSSIFLLAAIIPQIGSRLTSLFNPRAFGSVFWIWLAALAFSQLMYNNTLQLHWRIALGGILAAQFFISIVQNSAWTSGWVPPVAAIVTIMVLGRSKMLYLAFAGGIAMLIIKYQSFYELLMGGDNAYSLDTRLAAWQVLGKIFDANPIFGLGPANYYWYTPLFRIMGYYVPFNSHNNYVDIIAQVGLVGLFFFLLWAWRTGWLGLEMRSRVPEGFACAYVYGALGGLAGMLVAAMFGDWVIPFVYNIGFIGFRASIQGWLFLGGLVALEQMYPKQAQ